MAARSCSWPATTSGTTTNTRRSVSSLVAALAAGVLLALALLAGLPLAVALPAVLLAAREMCQPAAGFVPARTGRPWPWQTCRPWH